MIIFFFNFKSLWRFDLIDFVKFVRLFFIIFFVCVFCLKIAGGRIERNGNRVGLFLQLELAESTLDGSGSCDARKEWMRNGRVGEGGRGGRWMLKFVDNCAWNRMYSKLIASNHPSKIAIIIKISNYLIIIKLIHYLFDYH